LLLLRRQELPYPFSLWLLEETGELISTLQEPAAPSSQDIVRIVADLRVHMLDMAARVERLVD